MEKVSFSFIIDLVMCFGMDILIFWVFFCGWGGGIMGDVYV